MGLKSINGSPATIDLAQTRAYFRSVWKQRPVNFAATDPSVKVSPMSKLSLDRILQSQGFGTRKYCRALIEDGDVAVNGAIVDNYKLTVETDGLVLTVFDDEWIYRERVYVALYKPANFECSRKPSHHPGVLTLLPEQFTWRLGEDWAWMKGPSSDIRSRPVVSWSRRPTGCTSRQVNCSGSRVRTPGWWLGLREHSKLAGLYSAI